MITAEITPEVWSGSNIGVEADYVSLVDVQQKPQLITDLLLKDEQVSIIIERQGDQIRFAYMKTYRQDTRRIVREARQECIELLNRGYTREQAIEDFWDAQAAISEYLPS